MSWRHAVPGLAVALSLHGCAPAAVVAGGATAVVVAQDRRSVGAQIDDETIEVRAGSAISGEPHLKGQVHVNVTSFNGIVLLTGEARDSEARDLVLAQVRTVPNVRRVVNEVRIAEPSSIGKRGSDTWLTTKVKGKLTAAEGLESSQIKVVTENAAVYLMGLVNRDEAERASEAARTVGGVERVMRVFEYLD
jgi:osmotically-inducible protein OsmY